MSLSYCRGRETPLTRLDGKKAGKLYPGKTGGGAAIIYNRNRFEAQTVRARELAFLENVHPPPRVTCHVSNVKRNMSCVMCCMSLVRCHV